MLRMCIPKRFNTQIYSPLIKKMQGDVHWELCPYFTPPTPPPEGSGQALLGGIVVDCVLLHGGNHCWLSPHY